MMDPIVIGIIGILVFILMMIIGVPIGISMALVGFVGFAYLVSANAALSKVALTPFTTMTDYNFAVVPAFILMAQVFGVSGLGGKLYELCERWLGHFRGGLALATIAAAAVFASISSSTVATVVTIGVIAIPEMIKRKYDSGFGGATVAAAGGLGILIPPSSILILYGLMTEVSIQKLFIAGIIPGITLVMMYMLTILIVTRFKNDIAPPGPKYSMKEKLRALAATWEILLLIILCIGGLSLGWFTPTEAGAVGAVGAIFISWIRRKLTWKKLMQSLLATAANSGMVGLILIGAFIFNYFVTVTEIPQQLIIAIDNINASPIIIMLIVTVIYLILGMFMDSLSMLLLTVPFMFPVALSLGFDSIWFGIYCVMVMEMAVITPPVGINLFATAGLFKELTLESIYKRVAPFVLAQLAVIFIMLLLPEFVTFLPNLLSRN